MKLILLLHHGTTGHTEKTARDQGRLSPREAPQNMSDLPNASHVITYCLLACKIRCYQILKCSFLADDFTMLHHPNDKCSESQEREKLMFLFTVSFFFLVVVVCLFLCTYIKNQTNVA